MSARVSIFHRLSINGFSLTQPPEPANQQPLVPIPSPNKWEGLAAGRAFGCKTYAKLIVIRISMDITKTRAFSRRDAQHHRRGALGSGLRLLYLERIGLKKLAQRGTKREQQKIVTPVAVGILNVGTLTERSMELIDVMERRKSIVFCLQATKWKWQKIREMDNGYKLYYNRVDDRGMLWGLCWIRS